MGERGGAGKADAEEFVVAHQHGEVPLRAEAFDIGQFAGFQAQADRMDRNGDGKISRDEFAAFIPDRLLRADTNGDGALSISELRALRRQ